MIEKIKEKISNYKLILDKTAGGHSFGIVEWAFYDRIDKIYQTESGLK